MQKWWHQVKLGFPCQKIKAPLMVFPEMPLLSPAGKYKVRQSLSVYLAVWHRRAVFRLTGNYGNVEQRELVQRGKTSSRENQNQAPGT